MISLAQRLEVFTQAYGDLGDSKWHPKAIHPKHPRYLWTDTYALFVAIANPGVLHVSCKPCKVG
jgi:hypothetical protein